MAATVPGSRRPRRRRRAVRVANRAGLGAATPSTRARGNAVRAQRPAQRAPRGDPRRLGGAGMDGDLTGGVAGVRAVRRRASRSDGQQSAPRRRAGGATGRTRGAVRRAVRGGPVAARGGKRLPQRRRAGHQRRGSRAADRRHRRRRSRRARSALRVDGGAPRRVARQRVGRRLGLSAPACGRVDAADRAGRRRAARPRGVARLRGARRQRRRGQPARSGRARTCRRGATCGTDCRNFPCGVRLIGLAQRALVLKIEKCRRPIVLLLLGGKLLADECAVLYNQPLRDTATPTLLSCAFLAHMLEINAHMYISA